MSKAHRGKGIRTLMLGGTGACPSCGKTHIKVLYESVLADGKKVKVCKICSKKAKSA